MRDVGVCYANAFAVLLGPEDAEVPAGEAGELVVGGAGVAPGYAPAGSDSHTPAGHRRGRGQLCVPCSASAGKWTADDTQ